MTESQNPSRKRPLPPLVLWVGVLLADWCIMAPVLLVGAMMSSGWVGGSSHPENFWCWVIPAFAVLAVLSALVLFVWRHVRWFYWIVLVLLAIVSWSNVAGLYKGLLHPTEECGICPCRDRAVPLSVFGGTSRLAESARILRGTWGISQADRHRHHPIDDRLYAVAASPPPIRAAVCISVPVLCRRKNPIRRQ